MSKQLDFELKAKRNLSKTNQVSNAYLRKALTIELLLFSVVRSLRSLLVSSRISASAPGTVCFPCVPTVIMHEAKLQSVVVVASQHSLARHDHSRTLLLT